MYIKNLSTFAFRNLSLEEKINFNSGLNIFSGQNAQGKTSLLEALYLIANARSFRTKKIRDLVKWGKTECCCQAEISDRLSDHKIEVTINASQRKILVDQKPVSGLVDFLGIVKLISFAPEDLTLVKGAPDLRREFMDRHISDLDPSYLQILVRYNRALRSKNLLLKQRQATPDNLAPWNKIMAEMAALIINYRANFIKDLLDFMNQIHQEYALADGELKIIYQSSLPVGLSPLDIYEIFDQKTGEDLQQRKSTLGPHRDDFQIFIQEQNARSFASQGQTRSLALSLKFAVVEMIEKKYQEAPVILLDDLDSELDQRRLKLLYDFLFNKNRQIFISGTTRPSHLLNINKQGAFFVVKNGQVSMDLEYSESS